MLQRGLVLFLYYFAVSSTNVMAKSFRQLTGLPATATATATAGAAAASTSRFGGMSDMLSRAGATARGYGASAKNALTSAGARVGQAMSSAGGSAMSSMRAAGGSAMSSMRGMGSTLQAVSRTAITNASNLSSSMMKMLTNFRNNAAQYFQSSSLMGRLVGQIKGTYKTLKSFYQELRQTKGLVSKNMFAKIKEAWAKTKGKYTTGKTGVERGSAVNDNSAVKAAHKAAIAERKAMNELKKFEMKGTGLEKGSAVNDNSARIAAHKAGVAEKQALRESNSQ